METFRPFTEKTDALTLVAGELYSLEVEMVVQYSDLEFSLGFEHVDSGLIQDPISKEHLTWKQKSKTLVNVLKHHLLSFKMVFKDCWPDSESFL